MTQHTEKDNKKPQVLVAGGGTAGCAAAVAAARRGCSVLLAEEQNCLGGVSTACGVNEWFANLDGLGDIFERVKEEMERFGARWRRCFNGEYLKIVWQMLAEEAGVEVLFHTTVAEADAAGGTVRRVRLLSCSTPIDVEPVYTIDATGEGDLAALAGAPFMKGHPDTGRTLHMTLVFMLGDTGRPVRPYLPPGLEPIEREADLPGLNARQRLPDGRVYCNMTKVMGHDATDPQSLSDAEREARRQLVRVVHYLQRTEYPNHTLISSGARIGIREGRRIEGDYVLSEKDMLGESGGAVFEDGVCVATSQVDFHSLSRPGIAGWREKVKPYNIPFRSLVAKGLKNLLVAGKCISGDQIAQSSYRMTPTCCAMGQAAGTAAALAVEKGAAGVREVDAADLRAELAAAGMELDPRRHESFAPVLSEDPTRGA